jgi:DNA-binding transcriptional ArsR family regulator
MAGSQLLPDALIEQVAQRFKLLSEPMRLQLLNLLQVHEEMSVQEVVEATGHRQANVSKHLGLMAREGLLRRRKAGLRVYYAIDDPKLRDMCLLVCGRLRQEAACAQEAMRSLE